uniref:F-box domain-containing protein n=1 Tax=Caenorhabditis tropicalis TaxID=1561998 RepID=A0A1I7UDX8_9PELO
MPIGYKWFSYYQEDEMRSYIIELKNNKEIRLVLNHRASAAHFDIMYDGLEDCTIVRSLEKELIVEENMLDVFCEDFQEFLMNRKTTLASLKMRCVHFETNTINQIFECMKSALKSRNEKLQVKNIRLRVFDAKQIIELLQFINPDALSSIFIFIGDFVDKELKTKFCSNSQDVYDEVEYLGRWNRGCRLVGIFGSSKLSTEILTFFKKMLNYPSVFSRIRLEFEETNGFEKEHLIAFFEPLKPTFSTQKPELSNPSEKDYIEFNLKDPSKDMILAEQIERLSLRNVCSLEVFANPLLMEIILKEIDWFDIQNLRKVSCDVRSCIDILKPYPCIVSYKIERREPDDLSEGEFDQYNSYPFQTHIILENGNEKFINYKNLYDEKDFVFGEELLPEEAVIDFKINILDQKSRMNRLSLESRGNLFEMIGNALKSRDTPLRVKEVRIVVDVENDMMNILPYLDSVEDIHIFYHFRFIEVRDLHNVFKLDQWRNALRLEIKKCIIMNSIQELNIINFEEIDIKIHILSSNDLIYLKENLTKSARLIKFKIQLFKYSIDDSLYNSMPPYHRVTNSRSTWFFPMLIPNEFLHILFYEREKLIIVKRVDRDDVPEDYFE